MSYKTQIVTQLTQQKHNMEQDLTEQTNNIDWNAVLNCLRPGAVWYSAGGTEYDDIVWADTNMDKPSLEDCQECWADLEAAQAINAVVQARQKAYQLHSDPIYFKWKRGSATEEQWLESVAFVKSQFPYQEN